jgi:hypothetical protein
MTNLQEVAGKNHDLNARIAKKRNGIGPDPVSRAMSPLRGPMFRPLARTDVIRLTTPRGFFELNTEGASVGRPKQRTRVGLRMEGDFTVAGKHIFSQRATSTFTARSPPMFGTVRIAAPESRPACLIQGRRL